MRNKKLKISKKNMKSMVFKSKRKFKSLSNIINVKTLLEKNAF